MLPAEKVEQKECVRMASEEGKSARRVSDWTRRQHCWPAFAGLPCRGDHPLCRNETDASCMSPGRDRGARKTSGRLASSSVGARNASLISPGEFANILGGSSMLSRGLVAYSWPQLAWQLALLHGNRNRRQTGKQ